MKQPLDNSIPLQQGGQYTFTFEQNGTPFIAANSNEIVKAISDGVPQVSQVSVSGESITGGTVDITFVYVDQDNNDLAGSFGAYMASLISAQFLLDSFHFVQAFGGPQGSQGSPDSLSNGLNDLIDKLGTDALYVGIGAVLLIVAVKFL